MTKSKNIYYYGILVVLSLIIVGACLWLLNNIPIFPETPPAPIITSPYTDYIDVDFSELSPDYDKKRICLYGDYSIGFEHRGFENLVWVDFFSDRLVDIILPEEISEERELDYGRVIACGMIYSFVNGGYGHLGSYKYLLKAEIIIAIEDEVPYKGKLNKTIDCEKISGSIRKDICYRNFAIHNKKVDECEFIRNKALKNFCLLHLADILSEPEICDKVSSTQEIFCYVEFVYDDGSTPVNVCSTVESLDKVLMREFCYSLSTLENIEWCNKILNQELKDNCLSRVAINNKDKDICQRVSDNGKAFCYADVAIKLNDLSICEGLPEGPIVHPDGSGEYISMQSECYWAYVTRTKNYEVCNRIKPDEWRKSCLKIQ